MAQIDDITAEIDPVNLPASVEYPNWRRKLSATLEQIFGKPEMRRLAEMFGRERGVAGNQAKSAAH
jgi:4-alpha-glucanotransferase